MLLPYYALETDNTDKSKVNAAGPPYADRILNAAADKSNSLFIETPPRAVPKNPQNWRPRRQIGRR